MHHAQVYVRGDKTDFNTMALEHGAEGWDYASVLPFYLKMEGTTIFADSAVHSTKGPVSTQKTCLIACFVYACCLSISISISFSTHEYSVSYAI